MREGQAGISTEYANQFTLSLLRWTPRWQHPRRKGASACPEGKIAVYSATCRDQSTAGVGPAVLAGAYPQILGRHVQQVQAALAQQQAQIQFTRVVDDLSRRIQHVETARLEAQ